jgi:predicted alpha/beta-fold hydrolase
MSSKAAEPQVASQRFPSESIELLHSSESWYAAFQPMQWLRNGHLQTLAGNFWRRVPFSSLASAEAVTVDPDGTRVLCHCHWQPEAVRPQRLTLLLVHGLEGSSNSRYMLGISDMACQAGCNVIRMNMRNCGGTESWTPTLYHSGMSSDVEAVLRFFVEREKLQRVAMIGYSMGGNLVLKLAGELREHAPSWLIGAVGVSPAMDLGASADALHEPANRFYEWHFLRNLMSRFQRKAALFPERYAGLPKVPVRSVREFDDKITAPCSGFADADDYYSRASSARVAAAIRIPTLVLHALDDPFIRMLPETRAAILANRAIRLIETDHGGHCAFLSVKSRIDGVAGSRHWAESTAVRFLLAAGNREGSPLGS